MTMTATGADEAWEAVCAALYTPVVGDILDELGFRRQFLPPAIRGLTPQTKVAGRAMPVLVADVTGPQHRPFGRLTEALDQAIAAVIQQVEAMGNLGIGVLCYNWMAVSSWSRTAVDLPGRGGALVTGFRADAAARLPRIADPPGDAEAAREAMWEALGYFLDAVVPAAERAGVRLGMHPDDPPVAHLRGAPRIMGSAEAFRRLLAITASPANGVTFCQGNFALME
ncbi:MAG: mannonate dehydratase, partial [Bifidobacteriaceae bacterium]|nr:mannonate dehydratase [Bifidobacteriaceae bacterium]